MRELSLFAGCGGGILGGYLLGWETVCAVEIEDYARRVLLQRQRDGILPRFPIWDDIRTFDGRPWSGRVDVISGGFPCQDLSVAGKRAGIDGERSGLWSEMARVIGEVRPRFAFVENVPGLTGAQKVLVIILEKIRQLDIFGARNKNTIGGRFRRIILKIIGPSYFGRVLGDLADLGYNARWCILGADDAGAPHHRKRIWILAYTKSDGWDAWRPECAGQERSAPSVGASDVSNTSSKRLSEPTFAELGGFPEEDEPFEGSEPCGANSTRRNYWSVEPAIRRVAHGFPSRVDRLKAAGNAQVPAVAALAFIILSEGLI